MIKGSINSIESFATLDGPGIRTVVFLNKCNLRCKYCHNPETWYLQKYNFESEELVEKIKRFKPYFKNGGGVTFSGGEPLCQKEFLLKTCKLLKKENIHIALDTAGYVSYDTKEILDNIDLVILDIKAITKEGFKYLTSGNIDVVYNFYKLLNELDKKIWIRQVIVPNFNDNIEYIKELSSFIKKNLKIENIEKIEFLPYEKLGDPKYIKLKIPNPYKELPAMDEKKCKDLYNEFIKIYNKKSS